jgi:hypothetical protein
MLCQQYKFILEIRNYLYQEKLILNALWFLLRIGRKYWKSSVSQDKLFVNDALITSLPDCLPLKWFLL